MPNIEGQESPEMYLKNIYLITQEKGSCRSVDIANRMEVSKPGVSIAVRKLEKEGFLNIGDDGMISLTETGQERAEITYEKYCFWKKFFKEHGISAEQADAEACRFEHSMSDEVFFELKASMNV